MDNKDFNYDYLEDVIYGMSGKPMFSEGFITDNNTVGFRKTLIEFEVTDKAPHLVNFLGKEIVEILENHGTHFLTDVGKVFAFNQTDWDINNFIFPFPVVYCTINPTNDSLPVLYINNKAVDVLNQHSKTEEELVELLTDLTSKGITVIKIHRDILAVIRYKGRIVATYSIRRFNPEVDANVLPAYEQTVLPEVLKYCVNTLGGIKLSTLTSVPIIEFDTEHRWSLTDNLVKAVVSERAKARFASYLENQ